MGDLQHRPTINSVNGLLQYVNKYMLRPKVLNIVTLQLGLQELNMLPLLPPNHSACNMSQLLHLQLHLHRASVYTATQPTNIIIVLPFKFKCVIISFCHSVRQSCSKS